MISQQYDPRLEVAAVRDRYNDPTAYLGSDAWHEYTAARIRDEVRQIGEIIAEPGHVVLNAGAGNNDFGILPMTTINLDISECGVSGLPNPLVANVERIPLPAHVVDTVICVGSVINYCDAAAAIAEFARVLRPGGQLVIEYESSKSAEFLHTSYYGKPSAIAETFYQNATEVVRVYAPKHVRTMLSSASFTITRTVPIHIVSPWTLLLTRNVRAAAITAAWDFSARFIPLLSRWAGNHLVFCTKRA